MAFDPDAFLKQNQAPSGKGFDPDSFLKTQVDPKVRLQAASEALKSSPKSDLLGGETTPAEKEYIAANRQYTESRGVVGRLKDAWDDIDFKKSAGGFLNDLAKKAEALTPTGAAKAAVEASLRRAVEEGRPVTEGEVVGDIVKAPLKTLAGMVAGAGEAITSTAGVGGRVVSEAARALPSDSAKEFAATMDLQRQKVLDQHQEGIEAVKKGLNAGEEFEAGRTVGQFAPIGVPGVQGALSKVSELTSGAGRTMAGKALQAASGTGKLATDVAATTAAVGLGTAAAHIPVIGSVLSTASIPAVVGTLTSPDALAGLGKYLRAGAEGVSQGITEGIPSIAGKGLAGKLLPIAGEGLAGKLLGGAGKLLGGAVDSVTRTPVKIAENYGSLVSATKEKLFGKASGLGEITAGAETSGRGFLKDALVSADELLASKADELSALESNLSAAPTDAVSAAKRSLEVSKVKNLRGQIAAVQRGRDWLESKVGTTTGKALEIGDKAADVIANAAVGAGLGTAFAAGMAGPEGNPIEGAIPGAFFGSFLGILGKSVKEKSVKDSASGEDSAADLQLMDPEVKDVRHNAGLLLEGVSAREPLQTAKPTLSLQAPEAVKPEAAAVPVESPVVDPVKPLALQARATATPAPETTSPAVTPEKTLKSSRAAASSKDAKAEDLKSLASSEWFPVRMEVAKNPNTPADVLKTLASDKNSVVSSFAAKALESKAKSSPPESTGETLTLQGETEKEMGAKRVKADLEDFLKKATPEEFFMELQNITDDQLKEIADSDSDYKLDAEDELKVRAEAKSVLKKKTLQAS